MFFFFLFNNCFIRLSRLLWRWKSKNFGQTYLFVYDGRTTRYLRLRRCFHERTTASSRIQHVSIFINKSLVISAKKNITAQTWPNFITMISKMPWNFQYWTENRRKEQPNIGGDPEVEARCETSPHQVQDEECSL